MTIIYSRGGRTYYLNGSGITKYIIGYNGVRGYLYTHDRNTAAAYLSFRRLDNAKKLFFSQYKPRLNPAGLFFCLASTDAGLFFLSGGV